MVVEMYVSAHDRAMFDAGDRCTFTVDGLLQTEYGSVKGEIKAIASDATMSENGAFFKVTVSFDDTELSGKGGDTVSIINGMTVRVWTVYEEATYMQYFLEKLGLT